MSVIPFYRRQTTKSQKMTVTELTPEIAQSAFEEFFDAWFSKWAAARQLQDTPRTSYAYFKGYVANDTDEEGKQ